MNRSLLTELSVFLQARIAGTLSVDGGGAMAFAYAPEWLADASAPPLSYALPKRVAPYNDLICRAVFGGLLPEEGQRISVASALGVSPDNPFRLLEALGGDVAGALAFLPPDEMPAQYVQRSEAEPLDDAQLAQLMDLLPAVPMLAGQGGLRLSLAGAQSKLPVVLSGGKVALPRPGEPSTHLIKPEPDSFAGLAANEAFCLALARAAGLDAARAERRTAQGKPYLLVERYDRVLGGGAAQRLHQEDFAQALGIVSSRKYAAEGGPAFRDSFALLRGAATRPAIEVLKLIDAALFNVIIGNADAHAKNFSLLQRERDGRRETVLSPLYDLVATYRWPALSPHFAMRFGGARKLDEMDADCFLRFAQASGTSAPFVRRRAAQLAQRVEEVIGDVTGKDLGDLRESIALRAGSLRDRAKHGSGG